jgi:hypothetical protein
VALSLVPAELEEELLVFGDWPIMEASEGLRFINPYT